MHCRRCRPLLERGRCLGKARKRDRNADARLLGLEDDEDRGLSGLQLLDELVVDGHLRIAGERLAAVERRMAEAMALGVPVISTDCPSGPAELLADIVKAYPTGVMEAPFGILVPEDDTDSLARAMRCMSAPDIRSAYAVRSRSRMAKFASEIISRAYWDLITSRKHT